MRKKLISFLNGNRNVILEKRLTSIPLKEEVIIAKSIEFFDDPEPCMIHRSAVMKRLYIEIDDFFNDALRQGKKQLLWGDIPDFIKEYIDIRDTITAISIKSK